VRSSAWLAATERRRLGAVEVGVGLGGLAVGAGAVALASHAVHHDATARHAIGIGSVHLAYPRANLAAVVLLPLALLGVAVLARAVRAAVREARRAKALRARLDVVGRLAAGGGAHVVAGDEPLAFCLGWLRPRVYVSAGALARITPDELRAVLAHERQHAAARDPLRLAAARVLREALFYLPVLRPLHERHRTLAELVADAAALRASGGDPGPIAAALLAFDEHGRGVEPERVDHLLGERPAWRVPTGALIAGLATIAAGVVALWMTAQAASAGATLALPGASRQPCILALALIGALAVSARRALRPAAHA